MCREETAHSLTLVGTEQEVMSLVVYCHCHVTDKQWSALDLTGAQLQVKLFVTQSLQDDVLDISHTTLAYSVLENSRGLELPRTRARTRT